MASATKGGFAEHLIKPAEPGQLIDAIGGVEEKRRRKGERARLLVESLENYRLQTVSWAGA